jgi:hypothetical protein
MQTARGEFECGHTGRQRNRLEEVERWVRPLSLPTHRLVSFLLSVGDITANRVEKQGICVIKPHRQPCFLPILERVHN